MADKTNVTVTTDGKKRLDLTFPFDEIQQQMARLWGWPFAGRPFRRMAESLAPWAPTIDVYETAGSMVIKAELPGVNKDDVRVTLEGNDLVIEGERKSENEVKEDDYYRMERSYGSFYRRVPMNFEVDAEKVSASYVDGVLEVRVPQPEQAKPQAKQIKVA